MEEQINLISTFADFKESKSIDRETLMHILEDVFVSALSKKYGAGAEFNVIVNVDRGDLEIQHSLKVVEDDQVTDPQNQISLSDAIKIEPDFEVGEEVIEQIQLSDFQLTMNDAIKEITGIDFDQVPDTEAAKKLADEKGIEYEDRHVKGDIVNLFFDEFCEDRMIQPTFIMDHPIEISPLTKKKPGDPTKVERFELYINGWEMCNAYSELNDPIDQRERFAAQDALAEAGDDEAQHTDEDFLHAMEIGMPPTGGIGYGIDRLTMLLTNSAAIRDVLLFPTMKSQKD